MVRMNNFQCGGELKLLVGTYDMQCAGDEWGDEWALTAKTVCSFHAELVQWTFWDLIC